MTYGDTGYERTIDGCDCPECGGQEALKIDRLTGSPERRPQYAKVGATWARWMICKVCGYEYWDCTCEDD